MALRTEILAGLVLGITGALVLRRFAQGIIAFEERIANLPPAIRPEDLPGRVTYSDPEGFQNWLETRRGKTNEG